MRGGPTPTRVGPYPSGRGKGRGGGGYPGSTTWVYIWINPRSLPSNILQHPPTKPFTTKPRTSVFYFRSQCTPLPHRRDSGSCMKIAGEKRRRAKDHSYAHFEKFRVMKPTPFQPPTKQTTQTLNKAEIEELQRETRRRRSIYNHSTNFLPYKLSPHRKAGERGGEKAGPCAA